MLDGLKGLFQPKGSHNSNQISTNNLPERQQPQPALPPVPPPRDQHRLLPSLTPVVLNSQLAKWNLFVLPRESSLPLTAGMRPLCLGSPIQRCMHRGFVHCCCREQWLTLMRQSRTRNHPERDMEERGGKGGLLGGASSEVHPSAGAEGTSDQSVPVREAEGREETEGIRQRGKERRRALKQDGASKAQARKANEKMKQELAKGGREGWLGVLGESRTGNFRLV